MLGAMLVPVQPTLRRDEREAAQDALWDAMADEVRCARRGD